MSRGANCVAVPHRPVSLRETPRIATSGALMIGVNAVPPMPPRLEMENVAALHVGELELALARLRGELPELARDLEDALLVRVRTTGTTSPFGVSAAKPMWK